MKKEDMRKLDGVPATKGTYIPSRNAISPPKEKIKEEEFEYKEAQDYPPSTLVVPLEVYRDLEQRYYRLEKLAERSSATLFRLLSEQFENFMAGCKIMKPLNNRNRTSH